MDGLKFNKSNFSVDTDRIWKGIVNSEKGNLLEKIQHSEHKFNGTVATVAFFVKDLFNDAIKLNSRISKQDTVYFSEDLDHLKRTQNKWGKEVFSIFQEENNHYIPYKETFTNKPATDSETNADNKEGYEDIAKVKSALADCEYNNKLLQQNLEKLKKQNKQKSNSTYFLVVILILLIAYISYISFKPVLIAAPSTEQILDTIYNVKISPEKFKEIDKQKKLALRNDTSIYIYNFNSKKGSKDTISLQNVIIN